MKKLTTWLTVIALSLASISTTNAGGGGEGYATVKLEDCKENNLLILSDENPNTENWPYRVQKPEQCIHIYNNSYEGSGGQYFYTLPKDEREESGYYSDAQLENLEVFDELNDGDQIEYNFNYTGGSNENSDGTRGYLLTDINEFKLIEGQAFNVSLHSEPSIDEGSYKTDLGKVYATVGEVIEFYYNVNLTSGVVDLGDAEWTYDQEHLECSKDGDSRFFDDNKFSLFCEVLTENTTYVHVGFNPQMEDGTTWSHDSNIIWVKSDVYFVDLDLDELKDNTEDSEIPPAGFEDEVLTVYDVYENPFPDTDLSELEGIAAAELYRRAVIGGYPDGEFKGYKLVNRAETAKFLLLARYGEVTDLSNNGKLLDVLDGQWYTKFVVTAWNKGIISGHPDGTFKPADYVNTAEFIKMLSLTFDLELNLDHNYTDVTETDWFAQYAGIAEKYELFPNRTNELKPASELSRNEVAVAIYQFFKNRD